MGIKNEHSLLAIEQLYLSIVLIRRLKVNYVTELYSY
jgi:hypothetical protein